MKLSSISLIASALIAISGSAIAAPAPLCALEQVNSFKRNIDGEPVDDLFTRAERHENPDKAASLLLRGADQQFKAAKKAQRTAKKQDTPAKQEYWRNVAEQHKQTAHSLKDIHGDKGTYSKETVAGAMRLGGNNIGHAKKSMKAAKEASLNPQ